MNSANRREISASAKHAEGRNTDELKRAAAGADEISRRGFIQCAAMSVAGAAALELVGCDSDQKQKGSSAHSDMGQGGVTPDGTSANAEQQGRGDMSAGSTSGLKRRVVRVFDPKVTDWDEKTPDYYKHIDQSRLEMMLDHGVAELCGVNPGDAWRTLFPVVVAPSEDRIFIKPNFNPQRKESDDPYRLNSSGQMICALISKLAEHCGFFPANITVCDPSRYFVAPVLAYCTERFPEVSYLHMTEVSYTDPKDIAFRFPREIFNEPPAQDRATKVPTLLTECHHFVNLHMMKRHTGRVTGAMKNLFGLSDEVSITFHGRPTNKDNWGEWYTSAHVAWLADQELIREKTRLLISEAIFTGRADLVPEIPARPGLFRAPGEGERVHPRSLYLSRSYACQDSVLLSSIAPNAKVTGIKGIWLNFADSISMLQRAGSRLAWLRFGDSSQGPAPKHLDLGVFEIGSVVPGTHTEEDLAFTKIDYRSIRT